MDQLRQKERRKKKKKTIKEAIVLAWVNVFLSFGGPEKDCFIIGPEKDL